MQNLSLKKITGHAIVLLVYFGFALILWPFHKTILFAILFAFALNPILKKIKTNKKFKLSDLQAVFFLVISLLALFIIPFSVIIFKIVQSVGNLTEEGMAAHPFLNQVQEIAGSIMNYMIQLSSKMGFDIGNQFNISSMISKVGAKTIPILTEVFSNVPVFIFNLAVFIALLCFFLLT